jgi:hypothetical protein
MTSPSKPRSGSSTGKFRLNLGGVLCAREGCKHRRDVHVTRDDGSHRWECETAGCKCEEFVIGGMTEEELRADTQKEMKAVRPEEAPPTDKEPQ